MGIITVLVVVLAMMAVPSWTLKPEIDYETSRSALVGAFVNNSARSFRDQLVVKPLQFSEEAEIHVTNSDFEVVGHVLDVTYPGLSTMRAYYINADLTYGSIHIECDFTNGTYLGNYSLSGTVGRNETLSGVGTWSVSPTYSNMWFSSKFDFEVVDGFAVLKNPYAYLSDSGFLTAEFPGLFKGTSISPEVRERVRQELGENLRTVFKRKVEGFLRQEFLPHLQQDFDQMTLYDIISGNTLPPRTTTPQGCNYDVREVLEQGGYELASLQENEVVLSSNVVEMQDGQIVIETLTRKTIVISGK